ncbi:MAG: MYXO-CTERM sorting domain-containing protein [Myxococcota bacterium]
MRTSLAIVCLALASTASADVIDENYEPPTCPPMTCPDGSFALSGSHGSCPAGCHPGEVCENTASCAASPGVQCVPTRFCIAKRAAGRLAEVDMIVGTPSADGTCSEGEPSIESRCHRPPPPQTQPAEEEDSGCSVAGAASGTWALLVLLALRRRAL